MSNKIYLPKDEEVNLFSVIGSRDGLVIPLTYWGYPNIHLTVYSREIRHKAGHYKFNIHLTKEPEKKKILEINYNYDKPAFNFRDKELEEKIKGIFLKHFKKLIKNPKGKLFCTECFIRDNFKHWENLDKKEVAEGYKKLFNDVASIEKKDFSRYQECNEKNHYLFYDLQEEILYIRYPEGFLTYSDNKQLLKDLIDLLKTNFSFIFTELRKIIKKIKIKLRGISKNEN